MLGDEKSHLRARGKLKWAGQRNKSFRIQFHWIFKLATSVLVCGLLFGGSWSIALIFIRSVFTS
jgi:hypothetical protein